MLMPAYQAFRAHAERIGIDECCGLIVGEAYFSCRNIAPDPSVTFDVHPDDYLDAASHGPVRAVCHSHGFSVPTPSGMDREQCTKSMLPWYIIGGEGALSRIDPAPIPILSRPYVYGWQDCYSIIHDFFGDLPDFPRVNHFWKDAGAVSPYAEHFAACGFTKVPLEVALPHDLLVMSIASRCGGNHVAILLDNGMILHHAFGKTSCIEHLGPLLGNVDYALRRVR